MRGENRSQNEQYMVSNDPLGWAIIAFKQRTRGGKETYKFAWVMMRYQTFLRGRRNELARPSGVVYYAWQPNRSEEVFNTAFQYWQAMASNPNPPYEKEAYPVDENESKRAIEELRAKHEELKQRLQTREGKLSPETQELAKQMTKAQDELLLNFERGTGLGDKRTTDAYANMLNAYGVVIVDSLMDGLPADEIAKRLFGYEDPETEDVTPSIFANFLANSAMHHHALDEIVGKGESDAPLVMTETMRSAEGHLLLNGLAALIDRVQNGEKLDPELEAHVCDQLATITGEHAYGSPETAFGSPDREWMGMARDFQLLKQSQNGKPPAVQAYTVDCGDGRVYTYYDWNWGYDDQNQLTGNPSVADFFGYNNHYARGAFMGSAVGNVVGDPLGNIKIQAAMARHLLECGKVAEDESDDLNERTANDLDGALAETVFELSSILSQLNADANSPEDQQYFTDYMMFRPAMPHVLSRLANLTAGLKFAEEHGLKLQHTPGAIQQLLQETNLDDPNSHVRRTLEAMFTLSGDASPMSFQKGYTVTEQVYGGPDEPHWVYAPDKSVKELNDHLRVWSEYANSRGGGGGTAS